MRRTFQHPFAGQALRRALGFTLVELMFTLLVAATLIGVGVPAFRGLIANNRLASQTNEIISAVNMARSEAITRNGPMTLCRAADENATTCDDTDATWDAWIILNAAGDVLRTGVFNNYGNTITVNSDLTDQSVVFQPDGLARTGVGLVADNTIVICSSQAANDNIRTITLGAGSRVSSVKSQGSCS